MDDDIEAFILDELEIECKLENIGVDKCQVILQRAGEANKVRSWLISRGYSTSDVEIHGALCSKYSVGFEYT